MGGQVNEIKAHGDLATLVAAAAGNLVVVDFTAKWCGPCRMIAPYYTELSANPDFANVTFTKVDVDEVEATAAEYSVEAMPTFVFIKNGVELKEARLTGASKDKLLASITNLK